MAFVSFNKSVTKEAAKSAASNHPNKVYFPTDSSAIVYNGKEYGGVTENDLNTAMTNVEGAIGDIESDIAALTSQLNAAQLAIEAVQLDLAPTQGSTNHLTSGAVYNALQGVTEHEIELLTDPVVISPNNLYNLGTRTSLDVGFAAGTSGVLNEYMFQFKVSGNNFTLTLPSGVKWMEEPDYYDGYIYQVSVVNNLAVGAGWEDEN